MIIVCSGLVWDSLYLIGTPPPPRGDGFNVDPIGPNPPSPNPPPDGGSGGDFSQGPTWDFRDSSSTSRGDSQREDQHLHKRSLRDKPKGSSIVPGGGKARRNRCKF